MMKFLILEMQTTSESYCCTTSLRYSHLYSYASNGNHQLLLADVLCGSVPCLHLTELHPLSDVTAETARCTRWEMSHLDITS